MNVNPYFQAFFSFCDQYIFTYVAFWPAESIFAMSLSVSVCATDISISNFVSTGCFATCFWVKSA